MRSRGYDATAIGAHSLRTNQSSDPELSPCNRDTNRPSVRSSKVGERLARNVNVVSGVTHPVGPEPAEVYWRRRLVVGLAVLLTIFALFKLFNRGGDEAAVAAPSQSASTASQAPQPSDSATPMTEPTDMPSIADSQTPTPSEPAKDGECSDADTAVSVVLDRKTTTVGTGLHLTMKVKNKSQATCKRDVGSGANEVTIISGPALIWSTDHCNPSTAKDIVELAPGQTWSVDVVWGGKLSAKGCKILTTAKPGAYWGHARNGRVNSDGARFVITK